MQHIFQYVVRFNAQPAVADFHFYMAVTEVVTGLGKGNPVVAAGVCHVFNGTFDFDNFTVGGF